MPISDELMNLQWKQLQHDENYHKDIWLLTVHHRVNHMVLHFAKYSGQLAQANFTKDTRLFSKSCLDTVIIAMSLANILNVNLSSELSSYDECETIDNLSNKLSTEHEYSIDSITRETAILVGKLAKAAESVDHLEKFEFRETLSSLVVDLFKVAVSGCSLIETPQGIQKSIEDRMLTVEKKSMFFKQLGNYKDGY